MGICAQWYRTGLGNLHREGQGVQDYSTKDGLGSRSWPFEYADLELLFPAL